MMRPASSRAFSWSLRMRRASRRHCADAVMAFCAHSLCCTGLIPFDWVCVSEPFGPAAPLKFTPIPSPEPTARMIDNTIERDMFFSPFS